MIVDGDKTKEIYQFSLAIMLIVLQAPYYAQNSASILWKGLQSIHLEFYKSSGLLIDHVTVPLLLLGRCYLATKNLTSKYLPRERW